MSGDSTTPLEVFVARLDERLNGLSRSMDEIKDTQRRQDNKLDRIFEDTRALREDQLAQKQAHEDQVDALSREAKRIDALDEKIDELIEVERDREIERAEARGKQQLVTGAVGLVTGGGSTALVLAIVLIVAAWYPEYLPSLLTLMIGGNGGSAPSASP